MARLTIQRRDLKEVSFQVPDDYQLPFVSANSPTAFLGFPLKNGGHGMFSLAAIQAAVVKKETNA